MWIEVELERRRERVADPHSGDDPRHADAWDQRQVVRVVVDAREALEAIDETAEAVHAQRPADEDRVAGE